jgi:hypothetical protein
MQMSGQLHGRAPSPPVLIGGGRVDPRPDLDAVSGIESRP